MKIKIKDLARVNQKAERVFFTMKILKETNRLSTKRIKNNYIENRITRLNDQKKN